MPSLRMKMHMGMCVMTSRTLANIGLSLLMVVTLLWGGCLSCPQYFMFRDSPNGCCNPAGHCKQIPTHSPGSRDCNIQPIALATGNYDVAAHAALPIAIVPSTMSADASVHDASLLEFRSSQASPPDL